MHDIANVTKVSLLGSTTLVAIGGVVLLLEQPHAPKSIILIGLKVLWCWRYAFFMLECERH